MSSHTYHVEVRARRLWPFTAACWLSTRLLWRWPTPALWLVDRALRFSRLEQRDSPRRRWAPVRSWAPRVEWAWFDERGGIARGGP